MVPRRSQVCAFLRLASFGYNRAAARSAANPPALWAQQKTAVNEVSE